MANITILGDGGWGTALALSLHNKGHHTILWGAFSENLTAINSTHQNKFLKGVTLPESFICEPDIAAAVKNAEIIVLAAPSQFMRKTLTEFKPFFNVDRHLLVNVAKGIENNTLMRISEICAEVLGKTRYVALSGPSHAEEVARNVPTAVVAASENINFAEITQREFMSDNFRVYTSDDVVGIELGGALKNVFAIAAGVADGLGLGDNSKAALMTRGIAEMSRLGAALGGKRETFAGLSGIGDLIVTCVSRHSRNRFVGEALGHGKTLEQINEEMGMVVAEGVKTCISTVALAKKYNIDVPIVNIVYKILYEGYSAKNAAAELMSRNARPENE